MKKNFNRNPEGHNQWILRSNEEIQKIIDKHPTWTKKDFRGEGKLNPNKKNFARKFAEQQATKRFIQPDQKKNERTKEKNFDKAFPSRVLSGQNANSYSIPFLSNIFSIKIELLSLYFNFI